MLECWRRACRRVPLQTLDLVCHRRRSLSTTPVWYYAQPAARDFVRMEDFPCDLIRYVASTRLYLDPCLDIWGQEFLRNCTHR